MTNDDKMTKVAGLVEALTDEDEAYALLHVLRRRFGWEGSMFSPDYDVRDRLTESLQERLERVPTAAEIEAAHDAFCNTYEWCTAVEDRMTETGWEVIDMGIAEAVSEVTDAD